MGEILPPIFKKIYANPITDYIDLFPIMLYYRFVEFDIQLSKSGGNPMFMEERHQEISAIIRANGKITVAEITEKYGISDEI